MIVMLSTICVTKIEISLAACSTVDSNCVECELKAGTTDTGNCTKCAARHFLTKNNAACKGKYYLH